MSSSIKVYLESKKAHTTFNETHKKFKLLNPISIKPNERIVMNVLDAEIPASFYNINSNNSRVINYNVGGALSQTIAVGNYSGEALATLITTNSLFCSYNELTNKFSFKSSNSTAGTIEANDILGITAQITLNATAGAVVEAQQQGKFSGINNIFVKIRNLGTHNIDSQGQHTDIVAKIPVSENFGGVINYLDHHNVFQALTIREIHTLDIELVDRDENYIGGDGGLGGLEWNLTLLFSFVRDENNFNISGKALIDKLNKLMDNKQ
jgi:hypothetical protein